MANTTLPVMIWEVTISISSVRRLDGWTVVVGRANPLGAHEMRLVDVSAEQMVLVTSFHEAAKVLGLSAFCLAGASLLLLPNPDVEIWFIGLLGPVVGIGLLVVKLRYVKWTFTRGQTFVIESAGLLGRHKEVIDIADIQTVSVDGRERRRGRLLVVELSGDRVAIWESQSAGVLRPQIAKFVGID